ncbi:MAG TPA: hypothetical protein VH418_16535 [Solirubrobacteraceae bacterium]|jgi:hypothetical protein
MRRVTRLLALTAISVLVAAGTASAATHYTGTLRDGATWIADVPAGWNGTLLLYSHGFGPLNAADAPDPATQQALLGEGFALAGSSYDPHGSWWALGSAVRDQFQTLSVVERSVLPARPRKVYAVGTSMGGLISALEDQRSRGRLDGALTTCGIVGGANNLNQYQLDGEYAIAQLLAPGQDIQLTGFTVGPPTFADSVPSAVALTNAALAAQKTPQGRARLALALAFLNVSPWGGTSMPGIYDYAAQEQGQYDDYFPSAAGSVLNFIVTAREQIEVAAGGEGSGTVGVDFARLLHRSSYFNEVKALYDDAGLSLRRDLARLARHADLRPDRGAYRWLARTSVPSGRLRVPELDLHTISDQLVPVQHERYYHALVARAGDRRLLKQAFVARQGHCNFTPGELVAGVHALDSRVRTGTWDDVATATRLNAAAGAGSAFVPFWPDRLTGGLPVR